MEAAGRSKNASNRRRGNRPGRIRSAVVARLASPHHPVDAGSRDAGHHPLASLQGDEQEPQPRIHRSFPGPFRKSDACSFRSSSNESPTPITPSAGLTGEERTNTSVIYNCSTRPRPAARGAVIGLGWRGCSPRAARAADGILFATGFTVGGSSILHTHGGQLTRVVVRHGSPCPREQPRRPTSRVARAKEL